MSEISNHVVILNGEQIPAEAMPKHIAIIMDGNGRWAKKRGMPRNLGHRQGAKTFSDIAKHCRDIGISYLTVYTFSTENWSRPKEEVDYLMDLLAEYLADVKKHEKENIRLRFLGDGTPLRADLRKQIDDIESRSAKNDGITVNIALNYGGRDEIVRAARKLAAKGTRPESITEESFSNALDTAGLPDPDILIRPSGELRLSNFLLWQLAYTEFVFMDVLWPDFTPADLNSAILQFTRRERRYGGL